MKPAPKVAIPRLVRTDIHEARKALGREPGLPVGVVVSEYGFAELRAYGARFPCPVAVDPTLHRDSVVWCYLAETFQQFSHLVRA